MKMFRFTKNYRKNKSSIIKIDLILKIRKTIVQLQLLAHFLPLNRRCSEVAQTMSASSRSSPVAPPRPYRQIQLVGRRTRRPCSVAPAPPPPREWWASTFSGLPVRAAATGKREGRAARDLPDLLGSPAAAGQPATQHRRRKPLRSSNLLGNFMKFLRP
jgi:hypothetical protein